MQRRWMLSKFFRDEYNTLTPVSGAYGHGWHCVQHPATDDGWALVDMFCGTHHVEAAKMDPRIVVCGNLNDPHPLPDKVIQEYAAKGATPGMSLAQLLIVLSDSEPNYLRAWHEW